ncbi:MAG TPA: PA domain-containing protein, partial [Candidatus Krumholzibacteria bacterium]|nr:PA domain-containing protein [Candidatus Krumholzibacteria bacterium]
MRRILFIGGLLLFAGAISVSAATITILNADGAGEGFNDPTPAAPVGGNPGTTIGQQRLNVFQHAANIWGGLLPSNVTIVVRAQFNTQFCDATSAVLGSAGPTEVFMDFPGNERPATWYHVALANKLANIDLSPSVHDINATFNSAINGNVACLGGRTWYYGYDGNEGTNIELLPVVLHELGHGLGFSTLVNSAGQEASGFDDLYESFIRDNTLGQTWPNLTNAQRAASAINNGNVVWNGAFVTAHAPLNLGGVPTLYVNSGAGLPPTMPLGTAGFGAQLDETGITGNVVLADDGSPPNSDACSGLINGGAINGNIALVDRGTCAFTVKAGFAQAAGATAVIIVDNVASSTPPALGGSDPSITIPVVSVTQAHGNQIKAALGGGVNVTLALDPNQLAGTDANNRVKLFAPNPYQNGSSISHWDVSALPNLLMEPAINNNLNDDVDLTLAHFTDLGWLETLPTAVTSGPKASTLTSYPNPFNPMTTIHYELATAQRVTLSVFDVSGRLVKTLESA